MIIFLFLQGRLKTLSFPVTSSWLLRSALLSLCLVNGPFASLISLPSKLPGDFLHDPNVCDRVITSSSCRDYEFWIKGATAVVKGWPWHQSWLNLDGSSLLLDFVVFDCATVLNRGSTPWGNPWISSPNLSSMAFIRHPSFLTYRLVILLISLITTNQNSSYQSKKNSITLNPSKIETMKIFFIHTGLLGLS